MTFLNKLSIIPIIGLTLILTSAGCNSIKDIEYIGVKETRIQSLGIQKGTIKVVLEYFNPNNFGIDIKETQLEVYANDQYVGIAESAEKSIIPKNSKFDYPILVHFNPLKAIGMSSMLTSKKINLKVKGTAKAGKGGVFIRVPINVTEIVTLRN